MDKKVGSIVLDIKRDGDEDMPYVVAMTIDGDVTLDGGIYALMNAMSGVVRSVVEQLIAGHRENHGAAWSDVSDEQLHGLEDDVTVVIMESMFDDARELVTRVGWLTDAFEEDAQDVKNLLMSLRKVKTHESADVTHVDEGVVEEDG
jgi:hypothetical protein